MIAGARPSARGSTASLHWLPEPLISTRGSVLHQTFTVDLAPTSRLLMREEQLLGRSGEAPGHLTTRLDRTARRTTAPRPALRLRPPGTGMGRPRRPRGPPGDRTAPPGRSRTGRAAGAAPHRRRLDRGTRRTDPSRRPPGPHRHRRRPDAGPVAPPPGHRPRPRLRDAAAEAEGEQ
ncbi:urease accessory protein UreD [Streptomyces sp. A144]|uniref:urease accessory protein UreD n=1 Tax=Streptomyces sp. A144 TaxID=2871487 RepID=UPI0035E407A2